MSDVKFNVTISELEASATKLEQQNEAFRECAQRLRSAGEELSENAFEGVVQQRFDSRMQERLAWLDKMAATVDEYIAAVRKAAADYQASDEQVAAMIRNK